MMYTPYVIGIPFITALGVAGLQIATETLNPKSGIEIHSLNFTNAPEPSISQNRTVYAKNKIVAQWSATIRAEGEFVCKGGGAWNYPAGTASPIIPIDQWVGEAGCWESLPVDVTLQACAKYEWGDGVFTEACTLGFRKVEQNG